MSVLNRHFSCRPTGRRSNPLRLPVIRSILHRRTKLDHLSDKPGSPQAPAYPLIGQKDGPMKPFILRGATRLPAESGPEAHHVYDPSTQVWMDTEVGVALVMADQSAAGQASRFGETTITETREGADVTEVATLHASRFGETTVTKTMEGADQIEGGANWSSRFGETTTTATVEGADQSEVASIA